MAYFFRSAGRIRAVRARRALAKQALGQWISGFKNHGTRNGTAFQNLSMESWKD